MIPTIEFRFSSVYNRRFQVKPKKYHYPKFEQIEKKVILIEKEWKKHANKILKTIAKIYHLEWKEKNIRCYIIGGMGPSFSDPLTLNIWSFSKKKFRTINQIIDILTHELIHQIQSQNVKVWRKGFKKVIKEKYEKEERLTRNHILLHAIHQELYLQLFNKQRLAADKKKCKKNPAYNKAWKIVEQEGHKKLIKKYLQATKK